MTLVDITQELFNSLSLLSTHNVVKSPLFNLLEGTQAIEMLNPKLDTGHLKFSQDDLTFNTAASISPSHAISIINKLIILLVSWLSGSNLPVTILSCRYVQTVLENYTKLRNTPLSLLEKCSLVDERLRKDTGEKEIGEVGEGEKDEEKVNGEIHVDSQVGEVLGEKNNINAELKSDTSKSESVLKSGPGANSTKDLQSVPEQKSSTTLSSEANTLNNNDLTTFGANSSKTSLSLSDSLSHVSLSDETSSKLVHLVLKSFIIGLCKFSGIILQLAPNILYEEEDLTTRNMNLDFLTTVALPEVFAEVKKAKDWLSDVKNEIDTESKAILLNQLDLVYSLNMLETVLYLQVPVFEDYPLKKQMDLSMYVNAEKEAKSLDFSNIKTPPCSFSNFIQSDLDNKNIPLELFELDPTTSQDILVNIFKSVHLYLENCLSLENYQQLLHFLYYDISLNISSTNVVCRALFQIFFIRDNKSVFGSPRIYFNSDFVSSIASTLIGENTAILQVENFASLSLKEEVIEEIAQTLTQMVQELESATYHVLTLYGNNPCRQQQLISKSLLIWDTLQASWENFESEIFSSFKVGEELINGGAGLTVSVYIFYTKLTLMSELLFRGIDLELYKNYELYLVFWYGAYLQNALNVVIKGRITDVLQTKVNFIEKVLPKRYKKLKAGTKKQNLKNIIQYNQTTVLPKLKSTLEYQSLYLIPLSDGMHYLVESVRILLIIYSSLGFIDFLKSTPDSLVPFKSLFKLRLKPWYSIGVPSLPTFEDYERSLASPISNVPDRYRSIKIKTLLILVQEKLASSRAIHEQVKIGMKVPAVQSMFVPSTLVHAENSLDELIKSSETYASRVNDILALIDQDKFDEVSPKNYKLIIQKGMHRNFPDISLKKV